MMLLITNENYEKSKIASLIADLDIRGVEITTDLSKAKDVIVKHNEDINLIVINSIVIDDVRYKLEQIKALSDYFSGPILAKVEDEKIGIQLMKDGLVNDYYVASTDKLLEFERLKKAFRVAKLRSRVSNTISEIKESIANLEKVNQG